jgi:TonB family protein
MERVMRRSVRAGKRASAALGLMLSLAATAVFAQQGRKVISNPEQEYPELAKRMNLTGVVKVTVLISADGLIKNVEVQGGNPVLVDSVEKALKKWKYAPASSESRAQMEFKF